MEELTRFRDRCLGGLQTIKSQCDFTELCFQFRRPDSGLCHDIALLDYSGIVCHGGHLQVQVWRATTRQW